MNLLMFLVSVLFSGVFYFFYLISESKSFFWYNFNSYTYFESFSWNLIMESIMFMIIWVLFYLYFSDFSFKKNKISKEKENIFLEKWKNKLMFNSELNINNILNLLSDFFKKYLYYIWFIFLYLWIYFIYKSLNLEEFSYVLFFVNIMVLSLFFITHKFFIFSDFMKINLMLFSVYYLVFYIYNFYLNMLFFPVIDMLNSLFVLFSFMLVFYNDKKILKQNKLDNALLYYFFIFLFSFISFSLWMLLSKFLWVYNISFILMFVWTFMSLFSYHIFTKINFLQNNVMSLSIISFIFAYLSVIIWIYYFLSNWFNFMISTILMYFIFFLYDTHTKFQNYISFFFSILMFVFLVYFTYFKWFYIEDDWLIFLILTLVLSLESIILTYFYDFKYSFDYYFFHMFSYVMNIMTMIYFLYEFKIDLFLLWIMFFMEAFYVFLSYYSLKQMKKLWLN